MLQRKDTKGFPGPSSRRGEHQKNQLGYNFRMEKAAAAIRVKVLFFGRLKELVGDSEESVDVAEGACVEDLFARCIARYPELARYRSSLVASCNQEFTGWNTALQAGDEVAFLPPVSGG
jgi:sulfur-carrier protein